MLNARRTKRLTGGDDRVEFVYVEPVLGGQRGFGGCVEREVAGQWRMRNRCCVRRVGVSGLKTVFFYCLTSVLFECRTYELGHLNR